MSDEMKRILAVVGDLPPIPAVAGRVMEIAADPESSAEDMREVIEQDPALAARILKVANSSLYSFSRKIETLRHAISLLGFRTVESLVMAASIREAFSNFGLAEKLLWEHATVAGAVATKLSAYGPVDVERDSAFTAGLLHDLGKVALTNTIRERYQEILTRVYNEETSFKAVELEELGFDHAELGALVGNKWKLPPRLLAAIRYHHSEPAEYAEQLPPESARLVALTTITTACCTRLGFGRRAPVEVLDPSTLPAWSFLGLEDDDLEPVLEIANEAAKEVADIFG